MVLFSLKLNQFENIFQQGLECDSTGSRILPYKSEMEHNFLISGLSSKVLRLTLVAVRLLWCISICT